MYIVPDSSVNSLRYRDNSAHAHECSTFWVGIFITFNQENYPFYCFMKTCAV